MINNNNIITGKDDFSKMLNSAAFRCAQNRRKQNKQESVVAWGVTFLKTF